MTRLALSYGGGFHVRSGRHGGYDTKRARTNPMPPEQVDRSGGRGVKSHLVYKQNFPVKSKIGVEGRFINRNQEVCK